MNKYELLQQIGDGTYGSVCKAIHRESGQLVAVKKMKQKYYSWQECIALPEVNVLRKLRSHPNVIKLNEVIRENNELFFVFEFMDGDLLGSIKQAKALSASGFSGGSALPGVPHTRAKSYMFQLLQALAHLHRNGYFHRDLKPENCLKKVDKATGTETLKLADFGLVKEIRARPPFTDYVSTRWYRAPEILLQDAHYNSPVDLWAAGCILAELYTTRPLFPGASEVDQIFKICCVLGTPSERTWPGGIQLARRIRYNFPVVAATPLSTLLGALPPLAVDLITQLLVFDPQKRLTAAQALQHPYFQVGLDEEPLAPPITATSSSARNQLQHGGGGSAPPAPQPNAYVTLAAQDALQQGKPGSEGRPRYPPVQITKPPSNPIAAASEQPSAVGATSSVNKYFLLPTTHVQVPSPTGALPSTTSPPPVPLASSMSQTPAIGGIAAPGRSPPPNSLLPPAAPTPATMQRRNSSSALLATPSDARGPLKPLTRFSPASMMMSGGSGDSPNAGGLSATKGITPKRSVQPLLPPSGPVHSNTSSATAAQAGSGLLDLDALMSNFAAELGSLSAAKRNTAVKPLAASPGPALPAGSPLASFGGVGDAGAGSFRGGPEASLQDLLSSSRYKVSPMKSSLGGGGGGDGGGTPLSTSKRNVKALSPAVKMVLGQRSVAPMAPSSEAAGAGGSLPLLVNRAPVVAPGGAVMHGRRAGGEAARLRPLIPEHEVK